ncbi:type IV secretion system protein VirB8 [Endobacter medicaginis]|uniref:Type IV secretion system protein VirB8 n=1 Tax=Endobacter medicaginis TaxID=1181271 RepID=A0A850NM04_9PROT|nr:type IV secretion system protein VirB8 [Endobacter medicaginis]MBB3175234.1 type IV secretion system protein VirB8 [Endobacter medicaginis]MCX5476282.1 type IV secretion system protein VirB8 [Endobacter medicaginis]NVN28960.1 type IV secretion system protein VirB8 [Endobacter medicaginis]
MNDVPFATPVNRAKLEQHYAEVEAFQQTRLRSIARINKFLLVGLGVSLVANLGLAWTVASLFPLEKLVPLPMVIRSDGTIDTQPSMSHLPATTDAAVIEAAVWEYVRLREGYAYPTARYNYDVVSMMSSDRVRGSYQTWFNYPNPASPQVTVGKKGQIDIERISVSNLGSHVLQVRFRKSITIDGSRPQVTTWTATLQYQQIADLPASARITNPGGILITSYQSSEDSAQ